MTAARWRARLDYLNPTPSRTIRLDTSSHYSEMAVVAVPHAQLDTPLKLPAATIHCSRICEPLYVTTVSGAYTLQWLRQKPAASHLLAFAAKQAVNCEAVMIDHAPTTFVNQSLRRRFRRYANTCTAAQHCMIDKRTDSLILCRCDLGSVPNRDTRAQVCTLTTVYPAH